MEPRNSDFRNAAERVFNDAMFVRSIGIELCNLTPGACETRLVTRPDHFQQDGVIHAGVQATMADHTAGTAATTLIGADEIVLTAEFKINLLHAATASELKCRATVIKPGKQLVVAKSELWDANDTPKKLISIAIVTLAVVKKKLNKSEPDPT